MSKKQSNYWKKLSLLLAGLWVLYKVFQRTNLDPARAINQAFQGSKYQVLVPYLIAQAKHETGNFTSNVFKQANNLFGMRIPQTRPSLRSGYFIARDGSKYSKYKTVLDSAKDMRLYLENQNFPVPGDLFQYVAGLKNRGYFGDSFINYLKGVQSWL